LFKQSLKKKLNKLILRTFFIPLFIGRVDNYFPTTLNASAVGAVTRESGRIKPKLKQHQRERKERELEHGVMKRRKVGGAEK